MAKFTIPKASHRLSIQVIAVLVAGFFAAGGAQARTFDLKSETVATYFGGSFGYSNLGDYAFGQSGGNGVTTDQVVRSNYGGEFGFVFTTSSIGLRVSGEYLLGKALVGVNGANGAGASYYALDSRVTAIVPMVSAEIPIWKRPQSRISLGGGAGYAFVSLDQDYRMTAAGTTALGVSDYIEKSSTRTLAWRVYLSGETTFVDTTTFCFEAGYRSIKVGSLASTKNTTAISGPQTIGSDVKNMDGSNRAFDLGGAYVSLLFRFYL